MRTIQTILIAMVTGAGAASASAQALSEQHAESVRKAMVDRGGVREPLNHRVEIDIIYR